MSELALLITAITALLGAIARLLFLLRYKTDVGTPISDGAGAAG